MEEWKVTITRANNGYILKGKFDNSEIVSVRAIEETDTEDGELEAMKKLLLEVKEYFGMYYSKHNQKNIVVEIENINGKNDN